MPLDTTMTPSTAPGERSLSYKIRPLLTHSICYWQVCIYFLVGRGGGELSCWGVCHGGIFHGEGGFHGVN